MINLDSVSFSRNQKRLLDNISLNIESQQHTVILGPNGSGKSLLLQLLSADEIPSSGTISILGETIGKCNMWDLRKRIGLVSRRTETWYERNEPVENIVASGLFGTYGVPEKLTEDQKQRVNTVLASQNLDRIRKSPISQISDGEKTQSFLARALISDPEVLVMDEPFQGLDLRARENFIQELQTLCQTKTLIYVCHHAEEILPSVKQVIFIKNSELVIQGTPKNVFNSQNLSNVFDVPLEVFEVKDRWGWSIS